MGEPTFTKKHKRRPTSNDKRALTMNTRTSKINQQTQPQRNFKTPVEGERRSGQKKKKTSATNEERGTIVWRRTSLVLDGDAVLVDADGVLAAREADAAAEERALLEVRLLESAIGGGLRMEHEHRVLVVSGHGA